MDRPRVLLAEDNAETAERLRKLLCTEFDVIASVEGGKALVDAAARLSPDVIVTDIAMPGMDGIEAAVLIRRHDPNARIVFVTVHAESMYIEAGLDPEHWDTCSKTRQAMTWWRRFGPRSAAGSTSVVSFTVMTGHRAAGPSMLRRDGPCACAQRWHTQPAGCRSSASRRVVVATEMK